MPILVGLSYVELYRKHPFGGSNLILMIDLTSFANHYPTSEYRLCNVIKLFSRWLWIRQLYRISNLSQRRLTAHWINPAKDFSRMYNQVGKLTEGHMLCKIAGYFPDKFFYILYHHHHLFFSSSPDSHLNVIFTLTDNRCYHYSSFFFSISIHFSHFFIGVLVSLNFNISDPRY